MDIRENAIFGRYSREECGLPPYPRRRPGVGFYLVRALLLAVALVTAGWLGGMVTARWREFWVSQLPGQVAVASSEEASRLLDKGRIYATALPEQSDMRRNLALAALNESRRAARPKGYYGSVRDLLSGLPADSDPFAAFIEFLTAADIHGLLDDYPAAFVQLEQAERALDAMTGYDGASFRLVLVNSWAYLLAMAPREQGGDPERALRLAELMISSKDTLPDGSHASGSAALLDTLAMAYHAAGFDDKAIATQSLALGLAEAQGLDVYIRHYDEFESNKQKAGDAVPPVRENNNG